MNVRPETLVQHHPDRADLVHGLLRQFKGPARLICDPEPTDALRSPWRTYRACLEALSADATHAIVLQDDVVVCAGFEQAAWRAIVAQPDRLLTFFVAGDPPEYAQAVFRAAEQGSPWASLGNSRWCPAVALCWPRRLIRPLLQFVDAQDWPTSFRADDEIIGRFQRWAGEELLATVPSLVEHPDDVPSLLGKRALGGADRGRIACCYISECDPGLIDWTLPPS